MRAPIPAPGKPNLAFNSRFYSDPPQAWVWVVCGRASETANWQWYYSRCPVLTTTAWSLSLDRAAACANLTTAKSGNRAGRVLTCFHVFSNQGLWGVAIEAAIQSAPRKSKAHVRVDGSHTTRRGSEQNRKVCKTLVGIGAHWHLNSKIHSKTMVCEQNCVQTRENGLIEEP